MEGQSEQPSFIIIGIEADHSWLQIEESFLFAVRFNDGDYPGLIGDKLLETAIGRLNKGDRGGNTGGDRSGDISLSNLCRSITPRNLYEYLIFSVIAHLAIQ